MKIKYQVFETAQVFRKLEFAEGKEIWTQRAGNVLKMNGKSGKKPMGCIVEPRDNINFTVSHAALQLSVDNS